MEATTNPTVLTADEVRSLNKTPLGAIKGVCNRVVWRDGESLAGQMAIAAGHHLGDHQHRRHTHHMWIVEGRVEILGVELGAGSYVHIPPGIMHDLDARATEGCTVYYLYTV